MPEFNIQDFYVPREQFIRFHERHQRWACIVSHVRAGKTVAAVMDLVYNACICAKPDPRFAYIAPYYSQAKDVAWTYLKNFTSIIPGVKINESELYVQLLNGARVRLYGADNYDRMRGIYLDGAVLDEPADFHPAAWPEVIRPRLSDRRGWAVFIGTPKGRNDFYRIREEARSSQEWFYLELRADETGILPEEELRSARASMTPEQYAQEYLCSFNAAIMGAYYGKEMEAAERSGRIRDVRQVPGAPVFTAWDLGIGDSTAIWIFQAIGNEIRVLDHIENHGQPLAWYVSELNGRGWRVAADYVPHDVRVRELGTGRTRVETLQKLGRNPRLVPDHKLDDGINAVRLALPKMWFDAEKCAYGIECLCQYRSDYDEKAKVYRDRPKHDFTSHSADAMRYLAVAYREMVKVEKPAATKRGVNDISVDDLLKTGKPDRRWA